MVPKWTWIIFTLVIYAAASLENDKIKAFIEMTEFEYEDACSNISEAEWIFINNPSNQTLLTWQMELISYASFKSTEKHEVITNVSKNGISDSELKYKYDTVEKAGDALLDSKDFETLVHFAGAAELQRLSKLDSEVLKNQTRKDVENSLSRNQDAETKNNLWTAWHRELNPLAENLPAVLLLVEKAAKANGMKDVTEYWELLSGYENGYNNIKYEWIKISNLHKKIVKFVATNLSHKYKITIDENIPAHLLGSLQGNDWTPILVDATPYPELMYNIRKNLWKKKLIGKSLYKAASGMSMKILNQVPQADFWDKSYFDQQCPSKLINFCDEGIMRVSTCYEPTIGNFLSAHKNIGKVVFNQMAVETIPVLNTANRYSALEETVSELFGILAASPAWLNHIGVMDNSTDNDEHLMTVLMITALDTLPRLAYYIAADMWRINAIETNITNSEDLISSWWKYRQEYEGIASNGTELPSFLSDDYITSNKPYLSKITGIFLAFRVYQYLMESTEVRYDSIVKRQIKVDFIKMIQQGGADNWMKIIDKYLNIDQISSDSILSFFSPLEDFIDDLEEDFEQSTIANGESELEELKKKIIEEVNNPPTTTTVATTTSTTRTVAKKKVTSNNQNDKSDVNTIANVSKSLEAKSSIHVPKENANSQNVLKTESSTKAPFDKSVLDSLDSEQENKPKINTNKAVWAVGAVLVAVIIICTIAIFGRQRCRKTPKNRRYI